MIKQSKARTDASDGSASHRDVPSCHSHGLHHSTDFGFSTRNCSSSARATGIDSVAWTDEPAPDPLNTAGRWRSILTAGRTLMPYDVNADLPPSVRSHLPEHAQDIFREAFNHAHAADA
ncbi:ChaB family protein, partial [Roseiarcus sp.]|uniref:ChaB family protein n=1 Tax=Roseiarcus sp. TaxID=1969460 RepID=UPI003BB1BB4A